MKTMKHYFKLMMAKAAFLILYLVFYLLIAQNH